MVFVLFRWFLTKIQGRILGIFCQKKRNLGIIQDQKGPLNDKGNLAKKDFARKLISYLTGNWCLAELVAVLVEILY